MRCGKPYLHSFTLSPGSVARPVSPASSFAPRRTRVRRWPDRPAVRTGLWTQADKHGGRHGRVKSCRNLAASAFFLATVQAQAQQAQIAQDGRVIVTGEGDVAVAPDHAQITGGVTTRAKSVKEA